MNVKHGGRNAACCWGGGKTGKLFRRAEYPVAGVTEARDDVPFAVKTLVERAGEDLDVGMRASEPPDPFGGGDEAHEADLARAFPLEHRDRRDGATARGEHRVKDKDERVPDLRREF